LRVRLSDRLDASELLEQANQLTFTSCLRYCMRNLPHFPLRNYFERLEDRADRNSLDLP